MSDKLIAQWVQSCVSPDPQESIDKWVEREQKNKSCTLHLALACQNTRSELQAFIDAPDDQPYTLRFIADDCVDHTYTCFLREALDYEHKGEQDQTAEERQERLVASQDKLSEELRENPRHISRGRVRGKVLFPRRTPPQRRVLVITGQTDASLWYHCGVVAQLWRKGLLHKVTDVWAEGTSPCALACTLHDQWHTLIDYKVKKGVIEYARVLGAATLQRLKAMNEDDLLFPSRTLSRSPLSITRPLLCLYPEHQDGLWSSLLSFITRLDVSHSTTDRRVLVCVSYANPQPLPPIIVGDDMPAVDEADLQSMWEFASALWKASLSLLQRADENYKGPLCEMVVYSCYQMAQQDHPDHVCTKVKRYVLPWIRHRRVWLKDRRLSPGERTRRPYAWYKDSRYIVHRKTDPPELHLTSLITWGQYVCKVVEDHMNLTCSFV